jgi:hypothetical protein
LQPADYAFDDAALLFERADAVKVQIGCHNAYYHKQSSVVLPGRTPLRCRLPFFQFKLGGLVFHD